MEKMVKPAAWFQRSLPVWILLTLGLSVVTKLFPFPPTMNK